MDALQPGQTIWTWCSVCMTRTDHVYQPDAKVKLQCVDPDHDSRQIEKHAEKEKAKR